MSPFRIFYGWYVAAALSIVVFLASGIRFAIGPFLKPMAADLGLTRGDLSTVVAISYLVYGLALPLAGRLVDRHGPRPVLVSATLLLSLGLVGTAGAGRFWELLLAYGIALALGVAGLSNPVASAVLSRWFDRRRGTAISLLGAAFFGGMGVFTPLATALILQLGWRATNLWLALGILVIVLPLALRVIRPDPERCGLRPDGAAGPPRERPEANARVRAGTGARAPAPLALLRDRTFWLLGGGLFTCGFSMNLVMSHGEPMLTDHAFVPMAAASAIGMMGVVAMGAGVAVGAASDRIGRKHLLALVYVLRAGGFALLYTVRDPALLFAAAALAGLGWTGSVSLSSALTGDIYGRAWVGSVFGLMFLLHQIGASVSALVTGLFFDRTGDYLVPFVLNGALLLAASGMSLAIPEPRLQTGAGGRAGGAAQAAGVR